MAQLICRYRKGEEVKWISHLDVKRTLERAMRRAELPLALTQGHNPHPRVSFGPPLPVGATGQAELLAIELTEALEPEQVKEHLNSKLPPGLEVTELWLLPGYRKRETFGEVDVAEYLVTVTDIADAKSLPLRVAELMAEKELIVQRGGERPERMVNLRPLILGLAVTEIATQKVELRMRLRTGSHGGARPQEVIGLLGLEPELISRCHRVALYASSTEQPAPRTKPRRRWARMKSRRSKN